jgi:hypothetical protein
MGQRLVTIASFNTPEEAELARMHLANAGVQGYVSDAGVVGNLWQYGNAVGGVKLQVSEDDAALAREVLADRTSVDRNEQRAWKCPNCGETVDAGFDICWNCGAVRDGEADTVLEHAGEPATDDGERPGSLDDETTEALRARQGVENPYVSPQARDVATARQPPSEDLDTDEGDARARRAFRAAVLGIVFCPPVLNFYSAFVLIDTASFPLSSTGVRQVRYAWVINGLVAAFSVLFVIMMLSGRA